MALGDNLGNKLNKNGSKKMQPKERRLIKASRIKYIVISAILFISAIFIISFVLWAKSGSDTDNLNNEKDNLYSAGRYFCRIKYPDNWEIITEDNGFFIDRETGLILQLYPYTTEEVDIGLTKEETTPAVTPEPIKIQTEGVLVSVYYQETPDFTWPSTVTPEEGATPAPTPDETGAPTPSPAPYDLDQASDKAVELMKNKIIPAAASEESGDYNFSDPVSYAGKNCNFKAYAYSYKDKKGTIIKGEMYVCSRAMSYYMVNYEAREDLYDTYQKAYQSMVNNFILSVFDY